jgi:hypothetical protein
MGAVCRSLNDKNEVVTGIAFNRICEASSPEAETPPAMNGRRFQFQKSVARLLRQLEHDADGLLERDFAGCDRSFRRAAAMSCMRIAIIGTGCG